jgi:hypothetical protein
MECERRGELGMKNRYENAGAFSGRDISIHLKKNLDVTACPRDLGGANEGKGDWLRSHPWN